MPSRSTHDLPALPPALSKRRLLTPPPWLGFSATLVATTIAVCAASVGVLLLLAYFSGAGSAH